jgi:hypothetical protein
MACRAKRHAARLSRLPNPPTFPSRLFRPPNPSLRASVGWKRFEDVGPPTASSLTAPKHSVLQERLRASLGQRFEERLRAASDDLAAERVRAKVRRTGLGAPDGASLGASRGAPFACPSKAGCFVHVAPARRFCAAVPASPHEWRASSCACFAIPARRMRGAALQVLLPLGAPPPARAWPVHGWCECTRHACASASRATCRAHVAVAVSSALDCF